MVPIAIEGVDVDVEVDASSNTTRHDATPSWSQPQSVCLYASNSFPQIPGPISTIVIALLAACLEAFEGERV